MQRISEHKIPSSSWYIYKLCSPSKSQGTSQKKVEENCKSQEPLLLLRETSSTRSICEISIILLLKQAPHYDNTSQHINVNEEISQGTIPGLKTTGNQCLQRRRIHFSRKKGSNPEWPALTTHLHKWTKKFSCGWVAAPEEPMHSSGALEGGMKVMQIQCTYSFMTVSKNVFS